ncbi:fibroblast growth factor receptor substrate 2-like [Arapaima gigas]
MGGSCSCSDKHSVPGDHRSKFKVINVDDDGNELGSGVMELTQEELVLHTRRYHAVRWPYLCLRRYGYDSNLFSFESGRCCQTGQGIFAFKCPRAEEIFNLLQDVMHSNSISVVEEPVQEPPAPHTPPQFELLQTKRFCTLVTGRSPLSCPPASVVANGIPRYPALGPRLPPAEDDDSYCLAATEVHTYVNTTGVQDKIRSCPPLDRRLSGPEDADLSQEAQSQVLLASRAVKFVLGPTPVQKQLKAKERRQEAAPGPGCLSAHQRRDGAAPQPCTYSPHRTAAVPGDTAHATRNCAQRRPALSPLWEAPGITRPDSAKREEGDLRGLKTLSSNGYPLQHGPENSHNYVNTENVPAPDPGQHRPRTAPTVFAFDLHRPDAPRHLHYVEVETERGSGSSSPNTPCTPTAPFLQPPSRRVDLYAIIDVERTAAMSSLQKAKPRDDGMSRKTRHNSMDVPS